MYSIARELNTTVDELKKLNNLTTNTLQIGQILKIPSQFVQEDENNLYTVKPGDSLYSIAENFNTTVSELKRLNNLTTDTLQVGQILKIPSSVVPSETYTVKAGDSLYSIARMFGTTVNDLISLNNLTSNLLTVGQVLKIPTLENEIPFEQEVITYTVQPGDSLYSIANRYNTTVDAIKSLNNLTSNLLSIGKVLKIPTTYEVEVETPNVITYTVQPGDSLYSIAKKYNVSVDAIKSLNNLTSNLLNIGKTLQIPTTSITDTTYVVQPGDNLYSIARKFNTTVSELQRLNNLTSNLLSVGQILILE